MELLINNNFSFPVVAQQLRGILQTQVAPRVAGCPATNRRQLSSITTTTTTESQWWSPAERLLQIAAVDMVNVLFFTPQQTTGVSCTSNVAGAGCFPTNTLVDIYYINNSTEGFRERLLAAIEEANLNGLFAGVPGLVLLRNITVVNDDDDDDGGAAVGVGTAEENRRRGLSGVGIATIALAAVALLLLLLLFVRRRKRTTKETEMEQYFQEIDKDDNSLLLDGTLPSSDTSKRRRRAYIVGEDDDSYYGAGEGSILRDLNDMEAARGMVGHAPFPGSVHGFHRDFADRAGDQYSENDHFSAAYRSQDGDRQWKDVHHCSSATCEICALRRQRPLFVLTGGPPPPPPKPPMLGRDVVREYTAHDTVEL